jgi:formylglycine-generating enzyme required for sulfatase activity
MKCLLLAFTLASSACVYGAVYVLFEMPPPCAGEACPAIDWVALESGAITLQSEAPAIPIAAFEMSKAEVTVGNFLNCVDAGVCFLPLFEDDLKTYDDPYYCVLGASWLHRDAADRDRPVNCITVRQMRRFAAWMGGRLPTAAEWVFAATSQATYEFYPWGDEMPQTSENVSAPCSRASLHDKRGSGCGLSRPSPVCAYPDGNSEQGICDLVGNIAEVVVRDDEVDDEEEGSYELRGGYYGASTTWDSGDEDDLEVKRWKDRQWDGFAVFAGFRIVREKP